MVSPTTALLTLSCHRFAFVLPVVGLVSLYSALRYGSLCAILFLSVLAVETFAPLSKVQPPLWSAAQL